MKVGDLVRMESAWEDTFWFYGVIIEQELWQEDKMAYHVHWFDDNRRTWEDENDLEVLNEKTL